MSIHLILKYLKLSSIILSMCVHTYKCPHWNTGLDKLGLSKDGARKPILTFVIEKEKNAIKKGKMPYGVIYYYYGLYFKYKGLDVNCCLYLCWISNNSTFQKFPPFTLEMTISFCISTEWHGDSFSGYIVLHMAAKGQVGWK